MGPMSLAGKTVFITGASRGIGLAIGLRAAADGANVVVTGKTTEPHPKLPGTIHTAAAAIEQAGGQALAVAMDVREEADVRAAVKAAVDRFGGIDVLVNNASAIYLTGTLATPIRRFDLMHQVNVRGTYLATQLCLPHLLARGQPARAQHRPAAQPEPALVRPACRLHHGQVRDEPVRARDGRGVPGPGRGRERAVAAHRHRHRGHHASLPARRHAAAARARQRSWPMPRTRSLCRPSRECTGRFFIDDEVLREAGVTDLSRYLPEGAAEADLMGDFFLD